MQKKKISSSIKELTCYEKNCSYDKSCANHVTAGDYRMEGGFSPDLVKENEEIYCKTFYQPVDDDVEYETVPLGCHKLGYGYLDKVSEEYVKIPLTVEELIVKLSTVKNKKMIVAVCVDGMPYEPIFDIKDNTGTLEESESNKIDGMVLLELHPKSNLHR